MATSSSSQHRILYLKLLETAAGQISKNNFVSFFSEGISSFTKEPLFNVASKLSQIGILLSKNCEFELH